MGRLFGTDGVRGRANEGNMTAAMALRIGRAVAWTCRERHREKAMRPRIVIGKDTRISGYMFETALTAGITSMGVDVLLLGPVPTPAVAFITRTMRADAGIVISASHNPYYDNGIKIFSHTGYKLPDEQEREIEELVLDSAIDGEGALDADIGRARRIDDAVGRYIEFCKNTFPAAMTLDGVKLVLDCANGATYRCAPVIFSELGAAVTAIHAEPDGMNINENCGSQFTGDLRRKVVETDADAGLAFDGDGDRLIVVDEKGRELSGDRVLAVCARHLKETGRLRNNLVVGTVMSNQGFLAAMRRLGIETVLAAVGDRNVLETMRERGAVLGGESSGHIIFHEHHTTGDGIISALQLLAILRETGRPLSELAAVMEEYPQVLLNVEVREKPPLEGLEGVQQAVREAEAELGEDGRVLVRYSGTQPLCRVMVEAPAEEQARALAERIAGAVRAALAGE